LTPNTRAFGPASTCSSPSFSFQRTADLNRAPSLRAYEARAERFERIAELTTDSEKRMRLRESVTSIRNDINTTMASAALRLIRARTTNAVRGRGSSVAYALLVAGIVAFALGTDYVSSERTEKVSIAKSCADARKAGATAVTLPPICGADPPKSTPATNGSPAQERAKAIQGLAVRLQQCSAMKEARHLPVSTCGRIERSLGLLMSP
jgi:hypothetical protein